MRIADLSPDQRPRERLLAGQGEGLSEADLLALLWGSGRRGQSSLDLAQSLLAAAGGLRGLLALGLQDWIDQPGLGPAKACQLWAALELSRRAQRGVSRPLALGSHVLVADYQGVVHLLRREDGAFAARASTDGSAVRADPVRFGSGALVQTASGGLHALETR